MPLEKQTISIPLTGGVENKIDPVLVDNGKLLTLQNATFADSGDLDRRDAFTVLTGTPAQFTFSSQAQETATYQGELLAIDATDNGTLWSYAPNATTKVVNKGPVPMGSIRKDQIHRADEYNNFIDTAYSSGVSCFVWFQSDVSAGTGEGVYVSCLDETTGALLVNAEQVSASADAQIVRVAVIGSNFVICWNELHELKTRTLAVGGTTLGSVNTVADDYRELNAGSFQGGFELAEFGASNGLLAYANGNFGGSPDVTASTRAMLLTSSGVQTGSTIKVVGTGDITIANMRSVSALQFSSGTTACVLSGGTAFAVSNTVTLSPFAAGVSLAVAGSAATYFSGMCQVGSDVQAVGHTNTEGDVWTVTFDSSNSQTGFSNFIFKIANSPVFGPSLAGHPFHYSGSIVAPMLMSGEIQPQLVFVSVADGSVVGKALYGVAGNSLPTSGVTPSTVTLSSGVFSVPCTELGSTSLEGAGFVSQEGVSRVKFSFGRSGSTPLWHSTSAKGFFTSGAFVGYYDGAETTEAGFVYYPEGVTPSDSAVAGNPNGTYRYVAVYEWVDNQGQRHQSAPSPASDAIVVASKKIDVEFPPLVLTNKSNVQIGIYRTKTLGTTYYRVNGLGDPIPNDTTTSSITYRDDVADANLGELLYTTGGVLQNDAPPPCRCIATAPDGRVWVGGLEDPLTYQYSQVPTSSVGLQWSETLAGRIPEGYGEITAINFIDDKVIIYTPTRIFAVVGQGPNAAGLGSQYSPPQLLPSDVGCIDQRSIVNVPDVQVTDGAQISRPGGQGYQSKHGYYLLDRALQSIYIGSPVEPFLLGSGSSYVINSATLLENKAQLRLTLPSRILVYDYLFGQWSSFTTSISATFGPAVNFGGICHFADPTGGTVYKDSPGTYLDGGTNVIPITWYTAWVKVAGLAAFQRLWRIAIQGARTGTSTITMGIALDYKNATAYGTSITVDTTVATGGQYTVRHHVQQQKCKAIQIQVTETPSALSASGAGISFSGLSLEIGVKKGVFKTPAASNF